MCHVGCGRATSRLGRTFFNQSCCIFLPGIDQALVMSRVLVAQIHAIAGGLNNSISLWSAAEPHYRVLILRTALTMSRHVIIMEVITTTNCHYIISNNYSLVIWAKILYHLCHRDMGGAASAVVETPETELQRYALQLPPQERRLASRGTGDPALANEWRKRAS